MQSQDGGGTRGTASGRNPADLGLIPGRGAPLRELVRAGAVGRARTRRLSGRDTDFSRALRAAAGGDLHPDPNRVRAVRRLAGSRHTGNSPYAMAWRLCATRAVMGVDVWGIAQLVEQLM